MIPLLKFLALQALEFIIILIEFIIILIGFILGMLVYAAFFYPFIGHEIGGMLILALCTTLGAWIGSEVVEIMQKYYDYE